MVGTEAVGKVTGKVIQLFLYGYNSNTVNSIAKAKRNSLLVSTA
jgi:hypothetical protein